MPLTTITLTAHLANPVQNGLPATITVAPNVLLVDPTDDLFIPPLPLQRQFTAGLVGIPGIVTTDNADLTPSGWAYQIDITVGTQLVLSGLYRIPATGETVDLSALTEAVPGPALTEYAILAAPNTFTAAANFTGGLSLDGTPLATPNGNADQYYNGQGRLTTPSGAGAVTSVNDQTGDVTLTAAEIGAIPTSAEGAASGIATLDGSGHLTGAQGVNFDTAGAAAAAQSAAETYTTTSITALHLGTASTQATSAFDAAGTAAAAQSAAENYAASAITALGLGSASTQPTSAFDAAGEAAGAQSTAQAFATSAVTAETSRAETAEATKLAAASNLSDLANRQTALNTLASAETSGYYLRGNGTNVQMSAITSGDLPAATLTAPGAVLATQVVVGAPTGVYATDVAAISAAVSAAGPGGYVYFPYNSLAYNVDGLAPLSGQTWYGTATLQRPTSSTASVIAATGITGFTMRQLTVDGNSASSATSAAAIYLTNTTFTQLHGVTVQNCPTGNAGIILRGAVRCLVDACQISNVGYGVLVGLDHGDGYSCYGNVIRGCVIDTTVADAIFLSENLGSQTGISVVGSVIGTVVTGCTVRNFGDCGVEVGSGTLYTEVSGCTFIGISNGNGNNGILLRDTAHANITGCTVSNLTKAGSTGVYAFNLNGFNQHCSINNVDCYNVGYGIIVIGGTSGSNIGTAATDIAINGGIIDTTALTGILLGNVAGFNITGTQIHNAGNHGISIGKVSTASATDGTITGARIFNSGQQTTLQSGIIIFQSSADIVISGGRIGDNQGSKTQAYGIRIFDTTVTAVKITGVDVTNGGTTATFANSAPAGSGIEVYNCTGISPVGLSTAVTQSVGEWMPSDHGAIAMTCSMGEGFTSSTLLTAGQLYLVGLQARQPFTTTKGFFSVAVVATTPTSGENWLLLYNSAGTLVASKEIDSNLTAVGIQAPTWTSPYSGPAGQYWLGIVCNAATMPTLYRAPTPADNASQNLGLSAGNYRICQQAGPFTTSVPSPLTVASNSISSSPSSPRMYWGGIE